MRWQTGKRKEGGEKRTTGQIWQQMYHFENKSRACGFAKGYSHKYTHYNFLARKFLGSDSHGEITMQKGMEINVVCLLYNTFSKREGND